MRKLIPISGSQLLVLVLITQALAGGYAIPYQSAKAVGLGNALTASVTDPSAVYSNPGALSEVEGSQILASLSYVNVVSSVTNSGRKSANTQDDHFIPTLFASHHLANTDITLGIGLYAPFGLATSYDSAEFTRFAAVGSELRTFYVTPAFAWRVHPTVSFGLGLSFIHSSALFSRALFLGPGTEGTIKITGTDQSYAVNVGVLLKPHERLKLGLSLRGGTELEFDGARVRVVTPAGARQKARAKGTEIPLPPVVSVGIDWQIDRDWSLYFVHDFTHWSEFRNLKARFTPALLGGALPGLAIEQNWKNTSTLRFGTSYRIHENWVLRGGVVLDESPIPGQTLGPSIPGADTLTLNSGLGWQWRDWKADVGYAAIFSKSRRVNNTVLEANGASTLTPGHDKYATFDNFISVSIGYRF